MPIAFTIVGASGRMGRELLALRPQFPQLALVGAICAPDAPELGTAVPGGGDAQGREVRFSTDLSAAIGAADVVLDFSAAAAVPATLRACNVQRKALLIGTTGLPPAMDADLAAAARDIPLLVAPNTSLGVTVLLALARQAGRMLGGSFDVEVAETHHRHKVDAPSGTALALARAVADAGGLTIPEPVRPTGAGRRIPGSIGFAVSRGGEIVGEHEVRFIGSGESVVLGHIATDRRIFAHGALTGALWLAGRAAGAYQMADVVGVESTVPR